MTRNAYSPCNELSLTELSTIAAGKDAGMFVGEHQNSGKQVGSMTQKELDDFYRQKGFTGFIKGSEEAWLNADDFFLIKVHVELHLAKG